jgi:hypothetical protein
MSSIYGINAQTYHRLPPEDQASVRASFQSQQTPAAPAAPPVEPLPAPTVAGATTAQDAVAALHALPTPNHADLGQLRLPPEDRQSIVESRNSVFNATRADAAQQALDRLAPQRSDYDALPPATANMEFQQAQQAWAQNPYATELQRIVDEATASPTTIPSYLDSGASTADTAQFTPEQIRGALAAVGVDIPADASGETLDAARELLATFPDDILSLAINPGSQVSFTQGAGLGTPNLVGPSAGYQLDAGAEISLSDVTTGVDFAQTQRFEASVTVQGGVGVDLSKTPLQRLYGWADRLGQLPDAARQLIGDSPVLRQVMKGLPVSGSYTEFTGTQLSYEATVTADQGTQLANGNVDGLPNPLDPMNMAAGTSVLMRGQALTGSAFEANYKVFTMGGTTAELSGLGFGVTRLEGSMVEIYSGPVDTVENASFFGIGRQGAVAVGFGSELSMESREMQIARLDLSTAEGQAAYQAFISGGTIPDWAPPGVQQSGTTEVFSHEFARSIGAELGPLSVGFSSESNGTITQTRWADGTVDYTNTYTSATGITSEVTATVNADGTLNHDDATWRVVYADIDPASANYIESAYDPSQANDFADNNQHVQLQMTSAELMQLRDLARTYVGTQMDPGVLEALDSGVQSPNPLSPEQAIAIAQTPDEVFAALTNSNHGTAYAEALLAISFTADGMPGDMRIASAD